MGRNMRGNKINVTVLPLSAPERYEWPRTIQFEKGVKVFDAKGTYIRTKTEPFALKYFMGGTPRSRRCAGNATRPRAQTVGPPANALTRKRRMKSASKFVWRSALVKKQAKGIFRPEGPCALDHQRSRRDF